MKVSELKMNGRARKKWEPTICKSTCLFGRTGSLGNKNKVMKFLGIGLKLMKGESTFSGLSLQVIGNIWIPNQAAKVRQNENN